MTNCGKKQDYGDLENLIKEIDKRRSKGIEDVREQNSKALDEIRMLLADMAKKRNGCSSRRSSEFSSDTLFAVEAALNAAMELNKPVKHIFCDLQDIIHLLNCTDHVTSWRFDDQINNLKFLLDSWGNPLIHVIPSSWGSPAVGLAMHGLTHHHPNLFLFGKDLPFWIMKSFINFGFRF
ncbi:uncharacterized protein LOC120266412 isoform X1 [Dioscorea cayenensis subsp. rotundata]|uniref:Uncharacterized protein LOC120266412 isoform X1 n=1 Tax=Dioscorea cayennensis subsp. rotundata TaxID=55577 RepID=A0AB40BR74_DIOCR|nr:uncharacterized protein LOC120266412 isoform X1 [Dioscorea cayenensis subsp. rotundata]